MEDNITLSLDASQLTAALDAVLGKYHALTVASQKAEKAEKDAQKTLEEAAKAAAKAAKDREDAIKKATENNIKAWEALKKANDGLGLGLTGIVDKVVTLKESWKTAGEAGSRGSLVVGTAVSGMATALAGAAAAAAAAATAIVGMGVAGAGAAIAAVRNFDDLNETLKKLSDVPGFEPISQKQIDQIDQANGAMDGVLAIGKLITAQFASYVAPAITQVSTTLIQMYFRAKEGWTVIEGGIQNVIKAFTPLIEVVKTVGSTFVSVFGKIRELEMDFLQFLYKSLSPLVDYLPESVQGSVAKIKTAYESLATLGKITYDVLTTSTDKSTAAAEKLVKATTKIYAAEKGSTKKKEEEAKKREKEAEKREREAEKYRKKLEESQKAMEDVAATVAQWQSDSLDYLASQGTAVDQLLRSRDKELITINKELEAQIKLAEKISDTGERNAAIASARDAAAARSASVEMEYLNRVNEARQESYQAEEEARRASIDKTKEDQKSFFDGVKQKIGGIASGAASIAMGAAGAVSGLIESVTGDSMMDLLTGKGDPGAKLAKSLDKLDLSGMIQKIQKNLISMLNVLVAKLPDLVQDIVKGLQAAIPALLGAIPKLVTGLVSMVSTVLPMLLKTLFESLDDLLAGLIPAIIDLAMGLLLAIAENIDIIIPGVIRLAMTIVETLVTHLPEIALGLAKALWEAIVSVFEVIRNLITGETEEDREKSKATKIVPGSTEGKTTIDQAASGGRDEVVVTDAYIPASGRAQSIRTTPGDAAMVYQSGGSGDPMRIGGIIISYLGRMVDQNAIIIRELQESNKLARTGSRSFKNRV